MTTRNVRCRGVRADDPKLARAVERVLAAAAAVEQQAIGFSVIAAAFHDSVTAISNLAAPPAPPAAHAAFLDIAAVRRSAR